MISAPLTAFASEDAARLVLGLSANCPLCNNFSPFLFSTTKRNFSPLLRISIFPPINVLLVVVGIRVYVARRQSAALALPCCRRIDTPQLPTQSFEWCGVVWAVHLAPSMQRPRPRRGYCVRRCSRNGVPCCFSRGLTS